ncbi:MAG: ABC transporter permease, partial [Pseudomonadota bacterium]
MDAATFDLRRYLRGSSHTFGVWIALAALILFGVWRYENFDSAYNISSFLNYNSMFIVIAIGMCFVIMTGGIDLSVGSVAAFTSVCAAYLSPYGIEVALPGGVLAGVAIGG